ncbi:MAG: hypothetical protein KGJ23_08035 [Euryarchaeota archaeon]|nr:hypothetical protein [Euryarchaeota archaeon]MDE1836550.1 hypothetical protein [Euryarchaeota archaeon]MDE1879255.1 hypothetical protein [Euryarchaeota archaeon]MDE2044520.1 hypothetical protein [Thermoplasmata archaeon]
MPLYVVTVTKTWRVRVNARDPRDAREKALRDVDPEYMDYGEEKVVCEKVLQGK